MSDERNQPWELGGDLPVEDPSDDAYGYAPFASRLATAIVDNKSPKGLVIAVHGRWGSGKSSLLNFIKHDLKKLPDARRPVMVDFNPWWFEGRDQIATQLLAEFSSQLPDKLKFARKAAKLLGQYSKEIATAAATYSGQSWLQWLVRWLADYVPKLKVFIDPAGVPQLKMKVEAALTDGGKRFVFFVDDIDRLTPDEARDFFRAIKALADFPEVVYVLFFDREEVGKALTTSLGMDGEAYLEKIVQAPFHLPAVDRLQLQQKLFKGLDLIIDAHLMPFELDQGRWQEVYSDGLDRLIKKPRDIVRILNAISVTYPPVAGEVNPVDFIALEFLRVFEPSVYDSIRDAKGFFTGSPTRQDYKKPEEKAYFEAWKTSLPEGSRESLVELVGRIFPKLKMILTANGFGSSDEGSWRKELRPSSEDNFDVYFQFGVSPGHVSRAELDRIIKQRTSEGVASLLLEAKEVVLPDGHSKARDLIERLRDFDQLPPDQAANLIKALVDVGHLLLNTKDERGGFFSMPNRWRLNSLISRQLERLPVGDRQALLLNMAESSPGLWGLVNLANSALLVRSDPSNSPKAFLDLAEEFPSDLSKTVGHRLDHASLEDFMAMPDLDFVVHKWSMWGEPSRIREVFNPMLADDEMLMALLDKFVRTGMMQSGNKVSETYQLFMTSLAAAMDVQAISQRVSGLLQKPNLSPRHKAMIKRFNQGLKAMDEGRDPDAMRFNDDDE